MIKRIDKSIIYHILSMTMTVLLSLQSIVILIEVISAADDLGNHNYTFVTLLLYVLGFSATKIIQLFPTALILGTLLGLGKLAASNELTVMLTSGVSRLRILLIGAGLSATLSLGIQLLHEFIFMPANQQATQMRLEALNIAYRPKGRDGVWVQSKNSFVNITGIKSSTEMSNISIYTMNKDMTLHSIIVAETATFTQKNGWNLHNVTQKVVQVEQLAQTTYSQLFWENHIDNNIIQLLLSDPEDLTIKELYRYINHQKSNGVIPTEYALNFWQRLLLPLSAITMFLLALPFVFGPQRHKNQGRKLFIGVLLGLTYFISYTSIANIILLTGVPVILGAILPIAIFSLISLLLLRIHH